MTARERQGGRSGITDVLTLARTTIEQHVANMLGAAVPCSRVGCEWCGGSGKVRAFCGERQVAADCPYCDGHAGPPRTVIASTALDDMARQVHGVLLGQFGEAPEIVCEEQPEASRRVVVMYVDSGGCLRGLDEWLEGKSER